MVEDLLKKTISAKTLQCTNHRVGKGCVQRSPAMDRGVAGLVWLLSLAECLKRWVAPAET